MTMKPHPPKPHAGLVTASALLLTASLLFGCASAKKAEKKATALLEQNTILQKANRRLAADLAERNALTARLQMDLIAKQAEIDRLASSREGLAREAEYSMARMPAPSTRVEAVAYLAETETDIDAARDLADAKAEQTFVQADQLIAESKAELERGNYDKVYALASQAKEAIRALRIQAATNGSKKSIYRDFASPLRLQVAKRGNIRKKPGKQAGIIRPVARGATLTAIGYQGDWIKVLLQNGRTGWIYSPLLTVPATSPPLSSPAPGLPR